MPRLGSLAILTALLAIAGLPLSDEELVRIRQKHSCHTVYDKP